METMYILLYLVLLGALGGFIHWITPGEQKETNAKEGVYRVVLGGVAAALVDSVPVFELLKVTDSLTVLIPTALGVIMSGYAGVETWKLVTGAYSAPKKEEKPDA